MCQAEVTCLTTSGLITCLTELDTPYVRGHSTKLLQSILQLANYISMYVAVAHLLPCVNLNYLPFQFKKLVNKIFI